MMSVIKNEINPEQNIELDLSLLKKDTRYLFKYEDGTTAKEFSILETFEEGDFKAIKVKGTNGEVEWFRDNYFKIHVREIFIIGNIRKKEGRQNLTIRSYHD